MAHSITKIAWERYLGLPTGPRISGYDKYGTSGNHITPTSYHGEFGYHFYHKSPPGSPGSCWQDIPNSAYWASLRGNSSAYQPALNQAYKQFVDRSRGGISADMLTNAAEWDKTLAMVVNRVKPMIDFVKALRNPGRFSDKAFRKGHLRARRLAKARKDQPKGKLRTLDEGKSKIAGWYLEHNFGWAPTIDDIVSGVRSLGRDLPIGSIRGHGRFMLGPTTSGSNPTTVNFADIRVNCGAKVSISNPNYALLDCLGLANPALTAWNLIPFSFLADWAFDVSAQLASWSDLFGYNVKDPWWSAKSDSTSKQDWTSIQGANIIRGGWLRREPVLIAPKANLHVTANLHRSLKRAYLSLALLGSLIRRHK